MKPRSGQLTDVTAWGADFRFDLDRATWRYDTGACVATPSLKRRQHAIPCYAWGYPVHPKNWRTWWFPQS